MLIVGEEVSYGGWISSYSVLYNFSTKEHATVYTSIYWISITSFRFVLALVEGSPSTKIRNLGLFGILTTFIGYFLIFHVNPDLGLIVMTVLYGLSVSVLFPLLLTVPEELGYKLNVQ